MTATDEAVTCWAALVAYVDDVHAPQDNLTEAQWKVADQFTNVLNHRGEALQGEDYILFAALGTMLGLFDPPDLDEADWATAERMRDEYTALVEKA